MNKGLRLADTPALLQLGVALDELIIQLSAGAKAMQCSVADYANIHLDSCA